MNPKEEAFLSLFACTTSFHIPMACVVSISPLLKIHSILGLKKEFSEFAVVEGQVTPVFNLPKRMNSTDSPSVAARIQLAGQRLLLVAVHRIGEAETLRLTELQPHKDPLLSVARVMDSERSVTVLNVKALSAAFDFVAFNP